MQKQLNMKKIITLFSLLFISLQFSCVVANNEITPSMNKNAFEGFTITSDKTLLKGYEYTIGRRQDITFETCEQALNYDISKIPEFEYFRFRLLLVSCEAVNKFKTAHNSEKSFFPSKLSNDDYKNLPALAIPYLSKTEYKRRKNKTIKSSFQEVKVSSDRNGIKLLTKDDEFYIHILGRGDFNNDKIEDLLVSSEWYARHAHGKHTDLVILSKTGRDKTITIEWRLNNP